MARGPLHGMSLSMQTNVRYTSQAVGRLFGGRGFTELHDREALDVASEHVEKSCAMATRLSAQLSSSPLAVLVPPQLHGEHSRWEPPVVSVLIALLG